MNVCVRVGMCVRECVHVCENISEGVSRRLEAGRRERNLISFLYGDVCGFTSLSIE